MDSFSIINSRTLLDTLFIAEDTVVPVTNFVLNFSGTLQQASDGKIYGCKAYTQKVLAIQNPNLPGLACNYTDSAIYLNGRLCGQGFLSFPASFFYIDSLSNGNSDQEPDIENGEKIRIYPNPFNTEANIVFQEKAAETEIYDLLGRKVTNGFIITKSNNNTYTITRGENIPEGIYLINFLFNNKTYSQKLIITN